MKKFALAISISSTFLLLMGCSDTDEDEATSEVETELLNEDNGESDEDLDTEEDATEDLDEAEENETDENSTEAESEYNEESENAENNDTESDPLAHYSAQEIEYARVWLQLGSTDDPGTLNVSHVSEGEPINVVIDDAPTHPEDIILLTGEAGAMGLVAYSGNSDGTVNHYSKMSYRWPTPPSDMPEEDVRAEYEEILEHTELVEIDTHDDEDVIRLIEQLNYSE